MSRRGAVRSLAWIAFLAGAALVVTTVSPRAAVQWALAGDNKIADALFRSGKQAYQKADYASAGAFFAKAREEDAGLIEAAWWRASAQEKSGDKPAALASYREYLELFAAKSPGAVSKEEQRLKALAEKSIDALAAGEKELRKLDDTFVASLMQFAKDSFVRDPGVALKAIEFALTVRPGHQEALSVREKLGGAPAGAAKGDAAKGYKDVKKWQDLIAEKALNRSIEYRGGMLLFDSKGGSIITPPGFIDTGTSYVYETEFRMLESYDREWLVGLSFGGKDDKVYTVFVLPARVLMSAATVSTNKQEDLVVFETTAIDLAAWHRVGVVVRGPQVEVWFEGAKVGAWTNPSGADIAGEIGIYQQNCRAERRVLRLGRLD